MNREQRRAAARRARRFAVVGSASVLVASGASLVTGTLPAAGATTFHVTTLADNKVTPPVGSLRQAILDANANGGADIIDFQVTGTIALDGDLPAISDTVDIHGPGPSLLTINGQTNYHPFEFEASGANAISGLTITGGDSNGGNSDDSGGAIALYDTTGALTITNLVITGNHSGNDGGGVWCANGGGITIVGSTISGNTTDESGGGLYTNDCSTITIQTSTFSGNTASSGDGGGLYAKYTDLHVSNSTISGNHASGGGGGVDLRADFGYTAVFENSTISGNTAGNQGGAIYTHNWGTLTLTQTTVTGNVGDFVGGIYTNSQGALVKKAAKPDDPSTVKAKATHPHSHVGPAATNDLDLVGTILSGNTGFDIRGGGQNGDINSTNSLLGTVFPATIVHDLGGTLIGVNPLLGALASNGGPTMTHALLPGSPAINTGPDPVPSFTGNAFDQRGPGFARVVNGRVDIGAYEVPTVAVTSQPHLTG
jgi:predicted outer membrane repeat protein